MDTAFVVCQRGGAPDLPDLTVLDEKGAVVDGCGYVHVGKVPDAATSIYRVTTSPETIAAIAKDPKRWGILDDAKPLDDKAVADLKALLVADAKLAAVVDKETWTALTAHARTLAALGVTAEQFALAKPTAVDEKVPA